MNLKTNLNMTIASSCTDGLNLESESQLIKIGLLYADKIKLCSPKASMITSLIAFYGQNKKVKIELLKTLTEVVAKTEVEKNNINTFFEI